MVAVLSAPMTGRIIQLQYGWPLGESLVTALVMASTFNAGASGQLGRSAWVTANPNAPTAALSSAPAPAAQAMTFAGPYA